MDKVQGWIKISLSIVITIGFFAVMFYLITTGKYEQTGFFQIVSTGRWSGRCRRKIWYSGLPGLFL